MWQAAGNAARAAGRFARRHRRAIVVGGVVGAAACVYHSMKKALKEAEEEHAAMLVQVGDEARRRQCLSRTRAESVAALANFLPALKKRLFLAVDVTGPVRELKALRTGAGSAAAGARRRESNGSAANGNSTTTGANGTGGGKAATDGSAEEAAAAADLQSREVELWEQVKVTALTRLVVSLYAFSALALMLHMQLHILGRLSFEESRELLRETTPVPGEGSSSSSNNNNDNHDQNTYSFAPTRGSSPTTTASPPGVTAERGGTAGVTLSMEARHALLSSTYEHVLGDGLKALVRDVERAVSRCTRSWKAHTRQEVEFQDLVAVVRRVRRDVEGPVGGTGFYSGGDGGGGEAYGGGGRPSGIRHALLLRYIINPSDGIDGEGVSVPTATPAAGGHQVYPREKASTGDAGFQKGGINGAAGASFVHGNGSSGGVPQALQGVGAVLDETWDTAESPNFAAALQSCLDAAFGMVYEQLRQKAFCRGTATGNAAGPTSGSARHQARSVAATTTPTAAAAAEVAVGGLRASSEGAQSGRAAVPLSQSGEAATAAAAAAVAVGDGGGGVGFVSAAPAVAEREESAQVLATVISQAKLVVSDVLEASPRNEYAQAVASLPAVEDLCFSVFGSGGGRHAAPTSASPRSPLPPPSAAATNLPAGSAATLSPPAPLHAGLGSPVCSDGRAAAVSTAAAVHAGGHANGGVEEVVGPGGDGLGADGGCGGGGGVGGVGGPPRMARQRAR